MNPLSRRGFFLSGLVGLLAGLLGRTQAKAAPVPAAVPQPPADDVVSLAVSTADAGSSGSFTYTASGLPKGLSLNSSTGLISGTISLDGSNPTAS